MKNCKNRLYANTRALASYMYACMIPYALYSNAPQTQFFFASLRKCELYCHDACTLYVENIGTLVVCFLSAFGNPADDVDEENLPS